MAAPRSVFVAILLAAVSPIGLAGHMPQPTPSLSGMPTPERLR